MSTLPTSPSLPQRPSRTRMSMELRDRMDTIRESTGSELDCPAEAATPMTTGPISHQDEGPFFFVPTAEKRRKRPYLAMFDRLRSVGKPSRPSTPCPSSWMRSEPTSPRRGKSMEVSRDGGMDPSRPESAAPSLMSRSRGAVRRHGSKLSLSSLMGEDEFGRSSLDVSETCRRPQKCFRDEEGSDVRPSVSPPFGFRHVVHTQQKQFEKLETGSQHDLINEFVAIRASQRPRATLQGISADDLPNDRLSVQLDRCLSPRPSFSALSIDTDLSQSTPSTSTPHTPSTARSSPAENFSRPRAWTSVSKLVRPMLPLAPPPRTSSRYALVRPKTAPAEADALPSSPVPSLPIKGALSARPSLLPLISKVRDGAASALEHFRPTEILDDIAQSCQNFPLRRKSSPKGQPLRKAHSLSSMDTLMPIGSAPSSKTETSPSRPSSVVINPVGLWQSGGEQPSSSLRRSSHVDWSQKTVFVDWDAESVCTSSMDSSRDDSSMNDIMTADSFRSRSQMIVEPHVLESSRVHPSPRMDRCAANLEVYMSPFGLHQSSTEFRGYQHCSQAPPRTADKVRIVSELDELDAYFETDAADFGLANDTYISPDRVLQRKSSLQAARPTLSRNRSDASMLSNGTSTVRTCRSSTSMGSVPDLVFSRNGSRESFSTERTTDSCRSSVRSARRMSSTSQPLIDIRCAPENLPPLPALPSGVVSGDKQLKVAGPSPHRARSPRHNQSGSTNSLDTHKPKRPVNTRRRANSAATNRTVAHRSSYSLFPAPEKVKEITS